MKTKRKRKSSASRTPATVAVHKELFLKHLAKGKSPGVAARLIKVAKSAVYSWRKLDEEFDAAWKEAVETGLDELETMVYDRAMDDNDENARFLLKHRRYDRMNTANKPPSFTVSVTLQEQYKRLERLGLPVPLIETDYEEENLVNATKTDP